MKVTITNVTTLVPFTELKIGETWITRTAQLDQVNVVYVKVSDTHYAQLGGDVHTYGAHSSTKVRRYKITEVIGSIVNE